MTPEQAAELRRPFPPGAVGKLPKGGVQLDYVGHAATTDRLLSVDPEWTWEPVAFDEQGLPAIQGRNLWIRLTVCGVTRYGVGDGASIKEAIGDAIRNAAMRFGVALDLWSKEELEQAHGPAQHETAEPSKPQQTGITGKEAKPATRTMSRTPKADTLPVEDGEAMSGPQQAKMMLLFHKAGITQSETRHQYIENIVGRPIVKSTEITKADASKVIDALEQDVRESPEEG
jgi:hypothetical protein